MQNEQTSIPHELRGERVLSKFSKLNPTMYKNKITHD